MLDSNIRSSESLNDFKNKILKFIRTEANCFFNCFNPKELNLRTRLQLDLSHLRDQKLCKVFKTVSTRYAVVVLKPKQLFVICFTVLITYMKEKLFCTNVSFLIFWNTVTLLLIIFSSWLYLYRWLFKCNCLNATINYIISTKRFDDSISTFSEEQ